MEDFCIEIETISEMNSVRALREEITWQADFVSFNLGFVN